jgi:hypothetical protein
MSEKMNELPRFVLINKDEPRIVDSVDYVAAKTKDLREYGYSGLTEDAVSEQLLKVLEGEKPDVIGMFIKNDLVLAEDGD